MLQRQQRVKRRFLMTELDLECQQALECLVKNPTNAELVIEPFPPESLLVEENQHLSQVACKKDVLAHARALRLWKLENAAD
jgi:hypothetical protein